MLDPLEFLERLAAMTQLAGPTNEIRYGYVAFFVRDDPYYEKNKAEVWEHLSDAAQRVRVVFAMVNGPETPPPEFLGAWGAL